jgi:hypothetical protein
MSGADCMPIRRSRHGTSCVNEINSVSIVLPLLGRPAKETRGSTAWPLGEILIHGESFEGGQAVATPRHSKNYESIFPSIALPLLVWGFGRKKIILFPTFC